MLASRRPNLIKLAEELAAAGVAVNGLGCYDLSPGGDDSRVNVHTYGAGGAIVDLPSPAQAVLDAHVPPPPPQKIDIGTEVPSDQEERLANAVDGLRTFLATPTPTNAATLAALKATIRIVLFLLKRLGF